MTDVIDAYTYELTVTPQFARIIDGTGNDIGFSVTTDSSDNIYLAGQYSGTPSISDQFGGFVGNLPVSSGTAAFCSKFNSEGIYQYSFVVDSAGNDIGYSVTTDLSDNLYISGQYDGTPTVQFVNSSNFSTSVATLPVSSGVAAFCSKFNSTGTYQYSFVVDSAGFDIGNSVTADSSGNVYIGGEYAGTPTIKFVNSSNVATSVATLPASTALAAFCSKFNSAGTYQYSFVVDSAGNDTGNSVTTDSSDNVYLAGEYNGTPTIKFVNSSNVSTSVATLPVSSGIAAFCSKFNSSGTYQYSFVVDSSGTDIGNSVTTDSSGNLYLNAYYNGTPTIKFVNSSNVSTSVATLPASSGTAAFCSKFNSSGTYQYSFVVDASGNDIGYAVTTDSSDNVYVAGSYNGTPTVQFVNSSNVSTNVATLPASSGTAAVCSKFNSAGTYQYSIVIDSTGTDISRGLTADSFDNLYISGEYIGTPTIKFVNSSNVSTNVSTLPGSSLNCAFLLKFDIDGSYTPNLDVSSYSIVVDSTGNDITWGVTNDPSDNIYIVGEYDGTPTIKFVNSSNVATNIATLPADDGSTAAFCSKFNSSGTYQYSFVVDSTGAEIGYSVTTDSSGNTYLSGGYSGTPTIKFVNSSNVSTSVATLPASSGGTGVFCSKFNSAGTYQYSFVVDSAGTDRGNSVTTDSSGNVYIGGQYAGTPTIKFVNSSNVSTSVATLPASSDAAAFCSKFNSTGTYQHSFVVDSAGAEIGRGLTTDSSGNVYLAGEYNGTPTIKFVNSSNVSTSVATIPADSGGTAVFCSKFNSAGTYQYSFVVDSVGNDGGYSVTVDSSDNVYLAGDYDGTPTIKFVNSSNVSTSVATLPVSSGTLNTAFSSKFNSAGTYQFSFVVDSSSASDVGFSVTTDSSGNVYLAGYYNGTPTIKFVNSSNVSTSVATLPASSGGTGFCSKFNSAGTYQYSRIIDDTLSVIGYSVTADSSGNVYIGGDNNGTPTIKTETGLILGALPTGTSAFVTKFGPTGSYYT
jgi:hypothetical protein